MMGSRTIAEAKGPASLMGFNGMVHDVLSVGAQRKICNKKPPAREVGEIAVDDQAAALMRLRILREAWKPAKAPTRGRGPGTPEGGWGGIAVETEPVNDEMVPPVTFRNAE